MHGTPEANMTPFLARDNIIDGIKDVADTLRDRGITGTLQLVGGAAIVLTVNANRRLTRDIDATFAPKAEIERAARTVAERRHWPADWLNDDAAQFLPSGFGRPAEWVMLYQDATITIQAATHETLLAMKLHSAARRGAREAEDIADLLDRLGITSLDDAESLYGEFYPGDEFPPKTARIVESILAADRGSTPEPPLAQFC
ncbi:hypothetical protein ACTJI8_19825 [Microbacterium sp. 22303]|uniref:hypothetical protein n=1 Tax=Microbacterium sp. 22303 TaxID=3453905 RepID=UPI003F85280C